MADTFSPTEYLTDYTTTIELDTFDDVNAALFNKDLSRSFDRRPYDHGNIRDGIVSTSHATVHRNRRRVENTQFRPDRLREYEHEAFPKILHDMLDDLIDQEYVNLFPVGEMLNVVLGARRAGLDVEDLTYDELHHLLEYIDAFSQGSAILDQKDPDSVRDLVRDAYVGFERDFVRPARAKRQEAVDRYKRGEITEEELPHDILTVLLLHLDDPTMKLDEGRVTREAATYIQGATHTGSQTLINCLDFLFPLAEKDPSIWDRVLEDRLFAQRCIHETLRLRPTTPKIKRRTEADCTVNGRAIPRDALVILNAAKAGQDPKYFGENPTGFDPDRKIAENVQRWGMAFGAGPHQCPGRVVAGGLPVPSDFDAEDQHLFGLVALMFQEVVRRGVRPDPVHKPVPDTRTERYTRWADYPVRFESKRPATAAR